MHFAGARNRNNPGLLCQQPGDGNLGVGGVLLLVIILWFIWRQFRGKQKAKSPREVAMRSLTELEVRTDTMTAEAFAQGFAAQAGGHFRPDAGAGAGGLHADPQHPVLFGRLDLGHPAGGQGAGRQLGHVEQGPGRRLIERRRLDIPFKLGPHMLENAPGQALQLAGVPGPDVDDRRGGRTLGPLQWPAIGDLADSFPALLFALAIAGTGVGWIADHVGRELLTRRGKTGEPVSAFVDEMNKLSKAIGMTQTRFANPHGLEREGAKAYSTAADIARISIYAMRKNAFNFIVRQPDRQISVTGATGKRSYRIKNTNELIGEPGILGVKTGTTNAAGPCVSVCMDREPLVRQKPDGSKGATPRRLIVVVLNNPDRFNRARSLIRQGWGAYDPWLAAGAPVQDRNREMISVPDPQ